MSQKIFGLKLWHWIVIIALIGAYMGYWSIPIISDYMKPGAVTPGPTPGVEIYYGAFTIKPISSDYFTGVDLDGTNEAYVMYHQKPGLGVTGVAITADSGSSVEILKEDEGYVWMSFYHGDDTYLAEEAFIAANSRLTEVQWVDFDNDGKDELIAKVWCGDIGIPGQGLTPIVALSVPLVDEDDGTIADDDPSDQLSCGTGTQTITITWQWSGIAAEDGYFLGRMYFITNETYGGTDLRLKELTLSGGWTIGGQTYWSAPTSEENGDYVAWYFKPSDYTEPSNALPMWRGTKAADTLYATLTCETTFDGSDSYLEISMMMDWIQPDGAIDSDDCGGVLLDE